MANSNKTQVVTVRLTEEQFQFLNKWKEAFEEELEVEIPTGTIVRKCVDLVMSKFSMMESESFNNINASKMFSTMRAIKGRHFFAGQDMRSGGYPFARQDMRGGGHPFSEQDMRGGGHPFSEQDMRGGGHPFSEQDMEKHNDQPEQSKNSEKSDNK